MSTCVIIPIRFLLAIIFMQKIVFMEMENDQSFRRPDGKIQTRDRKLRPPMQWPTQCEGNTVIEMDPNCSVN